MTNKINNIYDLKVSDSKIGFGNNQKSSLNIKGKFKLKIKNEDGNQEVIILNNVIYIGSLMCNLLSVSKEIKMV